MRKNMLPNFFHTQHLTITRFGIAKCRYPALEVLTLDTTLPSLVIETAVEKSGSKVLKNANMGLCISITTYDAFTTPAGLDLIVKAIDLMGEE